MVVSASKMVVVAQLARASACGAEGYRIVPGRPPSVRKYKYIKQGNDFLILN